MALVGAFVNRWCFAVFFDTFTEDVVNTGSITWFAIVLCFLLRVMMTSILTVVVVVSAVFFHTFVGFVFVVSETSFVAFIAVFMSESHESVMTCLFTLTIPAYCLANIQLIHNQYRIIQPYPYEGAGDAEIATARRPKSFIFLN